MHQELSLRDKIIKMTKIIHEQYPALSAFINPLPQEMFNAGFSNFNPQSLRLYHHQLKDLYNTYIYNHHLEKNHHSI